jgi:hypothetical protein
MNKEIDHIELPIGWEMCDEQPFDARRFGEEISRACKTAEELGVDVVLDTPDQWIIIRSNLSMAFCPKKHERRFRTR